MKPGPKALTPLQKRIESGIPVLEAIFHSAVNNADKVPENQFSELSDSKNRRVEMWEVGQTLICRQKSALGKIVMFGTPWANVKCHVYKPEVAEET